MDTRVPWVIALPVGKGNRIYYPGTHLKAIDQPLCTPQDTRVPAGN